MSKIKRILTGLKPSGSIHIGNYFGSIHPYLDLLHTKSVETECFFMVADYHALISNKNSCDLRNSIRENVRDYLALGLQGTNVNIFRQSSNPDHIELAWILNCMVSMSFLKQAHAYKDSVAKGNEPNAGLFTYPILMASDIILYDTDIVPVGEDQRQHVEYAREAICKFTNIYGDTFKTPKEHIIESVGVVPGIDGRKMSKSYDNTIPMFSDKDTIHALCMKIVTDSTGDIPKNVYDIHKLFRKEKDLSIIYSENKGKYKILKDLLTEDINEFMEPLIKIRESISDAEVDSVLKEGNKRARDVSTVKMEIVRNKIGITI